MSQKSWFRVLALTFGRLEAEKRAEEARAVAEKERQDAAEKLREKVQLQTVSARY